MMHELDGVKKIKDFGDKIGGARKDMYNGRRGAKGKKKTSIYEGYYTPQPELSEIKDWNFKVADITSQYDIDKIVEMFDSLSEDEQPKRHSAGFYNLLAFLMNLIKRSGNFLTEEEQEKYVELLEEIGARSPEDFYGKYRNWGELLRMEIEVQNERGKVKTIELSEIIDSCEADCSLCTTYGFLFGSYYDDYGNNSAVYYSADETIVVRRFDGGDYKQCIGFLEWMKAIRDASYNEEAFEAKTWQLNIRDTPLHFTIPNLDPVIRKSALYIFKYAILTNAEQLNIYSDEDLTALKDAGYPIVLINRIAFLSYCLSEVSKQKQEEVIKNAYDEIYNKTYTDDTECIKQSLTVSQCSIGLEGFKSKSGNVLFCKYAISHEYMGKDNIIPFGYIAARKRGTFEKCWFKRYVNDNPKIGKYYWQKCEKPLKEGETDDGDVEYHPQNIIWVYSPKKQKFRFANRCGKSFVIDETAIPLEVVNKNTPESEYSDLNLSKKSLLPKFDFHFSLGVHLDTIDWTSVSIYATRGTKSSRKIDRHTPSATLVGVFDSLDYLTDFDNWVAILNKAYSMLSGYDERRGDCRYRKGLSWRDESKDVTEDDFMEVFGFRGVEFGNYVTGTERHVHMNATFDAFCDMAAMLGIPRKLVSLNGTLALAFGSRGQGGRGSFAAHYESDYKVINLTRPSGAGCLAHEWWHAFDNYVGEWLIKNEGVRSYSFSENRPFFTHVSFKNVPFEYNMEHCNIANDKDIILGNMWQWFARSKALNDLSGKGDKNYWTRPTEVGARCFETYLIYALGEYGYKNDYLCSEHYFSPHYPYPIFKTDKNFNHEDPNVDKVIEYFESVFSSELLSKFFGKRIEVNRKSKQELEKEHGVTESMMEEKKKKNGTENKNKADEEDERMRKLRLKLKLALAIMKMKKIDWANIPID